MGLVSVPITMRPTLSGPPPTLCATSSPPAIISAVIEPAPGP